jgi:type I restriction enzyme S subunit
VIAAHSQKLEALKTHKKGLMQNLFPNCLNYDSYDGMITMIDENQENTKSKNHINQTNHSSDIVPKYRFPEFAKDGEWVEMCLEEAVTFSSGGTPSKDIQEYWNGDIPWISASSMHDFVIETSELKITDVAVKKGSNLAKKGSLLILVRGSMLYKRIPICIVLRDVAFNQDVKSLRFKKDIVNLFLLYLLFSYESKLLDLVSATGIGAGKIDTNDLKKLVIQVPLKLEQQKIASCLSSLDDLITAQADKIEQLKLHKKGLMQGLFPKNV